MLGLGSSTEGEAGALPSCVVPLPFLPQVCAFSKELIVMTMASAFATFVCFSVLHEVEDALAAVWVFGQLILFFVLGSKSRWDDVAIIQQLWPCLLVGLACRALGVLLVLARRAGGGG